MDEDEIKVIKRLVYAAEALVEHVRQTMGAGAAGPGTLRQRLEDLDYAAQRARRVLRELE
jgi:hypothetical protein